MIDEIKKEALINNIPIIQDDSLKYICDILDKENINNILEIGSAVGYSAIMLSKYGTVDTVEISNIRYTKAVDNVFKCKLNDKIHIYNMDALDYLKTIKDNSYDVIFIDAAKGQYMKFLNYAKKLVKVNGIIIADNILFKGRVMNGYNEHKHRTAVTRLREYIKDTTSDINFKTDIVDIGDGLAISRRIQ
ncbi:MAG: O-methyltransferase [Clostridia bacterium]